MLAMLRAWTGDGRPVVEGQEPRPTFGQPAGPPVPPSPPAKSFYCGGAAGVRAARSSLVRLAISWRFVFAGKTLKERLNARFCKTLEGEQPLEPK